MSNKLLAQASCSPGSNCEYLPSDMVQELNSNSQRPNLWDQFWRVSNKVDILHGHEVISLRLVSWRLGKCPDPLASRLGPGNDILLEISGRLRQLSTSGGFEVCWLLSLLTSATS